MATENKIEKKSDKKSAEKPAAKPTEKKAVKKTYLQGVPFKAGQKIVVRQVRSEINTSARVRRSLCAIGLGRIGREREFVTNDAILGQISKVDYLLDIQVVK